MPRTKAKPVAQAGRTAKRPVIQKSAIQKPAIHRAVTEREITRKNIVAALQKAAGKLGRTPSKREFAELSGRSKYQIIRYFQTYRTALAAAGMMPNQSGRRIEMAVLMADWGNVARKVGGVPSQSEYIRFGSYSIDCLSKRVQRWRNVSVEFCRFVAAGGLAGDWNDVLEKIQHGPIPCWNERKNLAKRREAARLAYEARTKGAPVIVEGLAPMEVTQHAADDTQQDKEIAVLNWPIPAPLAGKKLVTATMLAVFIAELAPSALQWVTGACFPRRVLEDRPLLGAVMQLPGLAHEPVNEMGVILLFGMVARQLGFIVESVQAAFPDCEARMEMQPGRWQRVRIEFEYESRAFKQHNHDPGQCDLIICWRHNWKGCPANLQVLELSRMMKQLEGIGTSRVIG
jgi:Homing endonuclease associated repeat